MARGDLKTFQYYPFRAGLGNYNNNTDSFKYALITDPISSVDVSLVDPDLTDFTEVTAGGNYTAGGNPLPGNVWQIGVVATGITSLDFTDISLLKDPSNPTGARVLLVNNSTAGDHCYHAIDLTEDGTTAIDLVNNDLSVTWNPNGTMNVTVTA